jgi:octaprenyl-diphosphate synthase
LKMLAMKTGELFALSCDLGGFLSEATTTARGGWLREYGLNLGTAYQLYDDCLDVLGSEAVAGKTLGADLANGKMTLPILVVRDRATPRINNNCAIGSPTGSRHICRALWS